MKAMNLLKSIFVVACIFVANLTISANTPEANLIYNTEEVNGVKMSETVYKMTKASLPITKSITINTTTINKLSKAH